MAKYEINKRDFTKVKTKDGDIQVLKTKKFEGFNESILGLGDIREKPEKVEALSAIFDLEGFTNFCNQRDPELSVSLFLSEFLAWIFDKIKEIQVINKYEEGVDIYADLPFMCKYLGDGLLFLWDTKEMDDIRICNSIVLLNNICVEYYNDFYPTISRKMVAAPRVLRCGIAKGTVFSIGNGNDYVGSCINVSARLQKLHNLTFCFSTIGIDLDVGFNKETRENYIVKKVNIRGIGDEILCLRKGEFESLSEEDQTHFLDII